MGVLSILSFLWLPSTLPTLYLSSFLPAVLELVGHKHIHYPLWTLSFLRLVATCLGLNRCSINICWGEFLVLSLDIYIGSKTKT